MNPIPHCRASSCSVYARRTVSIALTECGSLAIAALIVTISACTASTSVPEPVDRLNQLLIEAVRQNRVDSVVDLLRRGAVADAVATGTHDGDTPLTIAAKQGNLEITRTLLKAGANANLRQHGAWSESTALVFASAAGHEEIVELLLQHGANVNARVGPTGAGPGSLDWAIRGSHGGVVALLLANGAIVDREDLLTGVSLGHVEIVDRLLAAGADPYWRLSTNRTLLEEAERSPSDNRAEMMATVLKYRGDSRRGTVTFRPN